MYVCYYVHAHADLLTCVTHVATRSERGRLLCSDLHTPMESTGIEIERVAKEEREREGRKREAFAQHLPDYSFQRPGGFTDGQRVKERRAEKEKERERGKG